MNAADDFLRKCLLLSGIVFGLLVNSVDSATFYPNSLYSEPRKSVPGPEKNYTGIRIKNDSLLLIYYHEQTLAIVEIDEERNMYNCELLEVRTKTDRLVALNNLKAVVPMQIGLAFTDMLDLMHQCTKLDLPPGFGGKLEGSKGSAGVFSGLFLGTKWCGLGDGAASYHDLGDDRELDKCCRNHDFCPVKVAPLKTQYNLTNYAIYTKSHCMCDDLFYDCLKAVDTIYSKAVGSFYFNVGSATCVEDVPNDMKKQFSKRRRRF